MPVHAMNHFTVLTDDLQRTTQFYRRHLGLSVGDRPDLGFPGAWMYAGGQAVLHIVAGRKLPDDRSGVLDHMAFSGTDLIGTVERLKADGIDYTLRKQAGSGTWQLFVFDPCGARVEIDFDPAEPAP